MFGKDAGLGCIAAPLDGDLEVVAGQVFGRQSGQAFVVLDEENAGDHPVSLTASALAAKPWWTKGIGSRGRGVE